MLDKKLKPVLAQKEDFVSECGSRFRPVYTPKLCEDGIIELIQTGVEDLQEIINADRDSCDMNLIIKRFTAGDMSALQRGNPVFMDLLGAPKTLAEAYELTTRAEKAFEGLPSEIRNRFDQNFYKFLSAAGTPEWIEMLKPEAEEKPQGGSEE